MRRLRAVFLPIIIVGLLGLPGTANTGADVTPEKLSITVTPRGNETGARTFSVALLCSSDAEREQGLQGFRRLRTDEAALFVFSRPQVVTFWMGTVQYPLDIIFVGPDGTVTGVAPDCRPGSSALYGSGVPVSRVIETAANSGILFGDRITLHGQKSPE